MDKIEAAMQKAFRVYGWDVCEWARVMTSARKNPILAVKADRLRSAAEFRKSLNRSRGIAAMLDRE